MLKLRNICGNGISIRHQLLETRKDPGWLVGRELPTNLLHCARKKEARNTIFPIAPPQLHPQHPYRLFLNRSWGTLNGHMENLEEATGTHSIVNAIRGVVLNVLLVAEAEDVIHYF